MFDVIVIGAGLSGLQAAYSAQQAGLTVAVVEARARVGGKVWSVPLASKRGFADLGAAWINDITQRRVAAYAKKFGLQVTQQRLAGKAIVQVDKNERIVCPFGITPEFAPEEKSNLEKIRDHIQAESLKPGPPKREDDLVSLDQYVRNLGAIPKTANMINLWAQVMHGVRSTDESAAYFLDYCRRNRGLLSIRADDHTGGQYLRLQGGAQDFAHGLAKLIGAAHIHLSQPVASIEDSGRHVSVITTSGKTFKGRKVIVSVPSTMYKGLNFSPALPARLRDVADATVLGDYNKAIVCYDRPWWRDLGYNGICMSFVGPIVVARDTSVDDKGLYALTCFVNGPQGGAWGNRPSHERRAAVLEQIGAMYGVGLDSEAYRPIEIFEQVWKHEPYSQGALVPVTQIGHLTEYADVYGKPVGNIHFVGTEYSAEWKGYMEGALCSGEAGAAEVAGALQRGAKANL